MDGLQANKTSSRALWDYSSSYSICGNDMVRNFCLFELCNHMLASFVWQHSSQVCLIAFMIFFNPIFLTKYSFAFFFCILTLWALQVQFLLQIIVNRISILFTTKRKAVNLKIAVAVCITLINISVYCIWIPARLQVSEEFIHINDIWDRCEKSIYLAVDALLNFYFMKTVHNKLVGNGLKKYQTLIKFNALLVAFSLAMDALIIGMMSLNNSFV